MLLMLKDTPVMQMDFDKGLFNVLNQKYLPFSMQGKINAVDFSKPESIPMLVVNNFSVIIDFLSSRVLPLDRDNAKKVYNALHLNQSPSQIEKAKISLSYKALCLQDNYWVKLENQSINWADVDLRQNSLNKAIAQIALHGDSITINGKIAHTPEVSTLGAYAKCWKRDNGELWLYKRGSNGDKEARVEVEVSNILAKTNVRHLPYYNASSNGVYCCRCKCMTDQVISMLSGSDYISYCSTIGVDWKQNLIKLDPQGFYHMLIVDYLISNPDRHLLNWGLFYNCTTMQLLGLHPLYDHNNAFDSGVMKDESYGSHFYDKSLFEVAQMAIRRCNFRFTDKVKKSDFYYRDHYESFKQKAKNLGLSV